MKRFSIRVVCSVRSGEGSARGGCSKRSYCSEAAGHVTGEGEREGGEGRRSPLSLPTVSIPDDLQKALKKVLERELIICHHPVIPISRDLRSSMKILTPEFIRSVLLSLSLSPPSPAAYPTKQLVSDGQVLYRHLMSRKTLSHVQESRRRRGLLRVVPGMVSCGLDGSVCSPTVLPLSLSLSHSLSLTHSLSLSHSLTSLLLSSVHLWREKQKHSQRETAESVLRCILSAPVNTVCHLACNLESMVHGLQ